MTQRSGLSVLLLVLVTFSCSLLSHFVVHFGHVAGGWDVFFRSGSARTVLAPKSMEFYSMRIGSYVHLHCHFRMSPTAFVDRVVTLVNTTRVHLIVIDIDTEYISKKKNQKQRDT